MPGDPLCFPPRRKPKQRRPTQPPLTIPKILVWAHAHRVRTGKLPTTAGGQIDEATDENWIAIDTEGTFADKLKTPALGEVTSDIDT